MNTFVKLKDLKAGVALYRCVYYSNHAGTVIQRIRILEVIERGISQKGNTRLPHYSVAIDQVSSDIKNPTEVVVGPRSQLFSWFTRLSAVDAVNCGLVSAVSLSRTRTDLSQDNLPLFIRRLQGFQKLYNEAQKIDEDPAYYDDWLRRGLTL